MIKAILFDMDGVLTHRGKVFSERLEEQFGIPLEKTLPFFTGVFQLCLTGDADLKEKVVKFFPEWGWEKSIEDFLYHWFQEERGVDKIMVSHVQTLREKGYTVLLGTNNERYRTEFITNELGFGKVFDSIYGSGIVGSRKPDPAFYHHILHDQKLTPEEVIFWDDDLRNVASAKDLGIDANFFVSRENFEKKMESYLG